MLGFTLDFWDYVTFLVLAVAGIGATAAIVLIAGLPGRIAVERKHPEAEAVKLMGYIGFLPVLPWVQAFIWAFKPTDVVDIRRFPKEQREATELEIARLKGEPRPKPSGGDAGELPA
jgi:hypothetical protein